MSDGHRICVCSKERGNKPVVITITTCRHNHPPQIEGGSFCVEPTPLATSSPIDVTKDSGSRGKDSRSRETDKSVHSGKAGDSIAKDTTSRSIPSAPDESKSKSEYQSLQEEDSSYMSAMDTDSELTAAKIYKSAIESTGKSTIYESAEEDATSGSQGNKTAGSQGNESAESQGYETALSQGNETSVIQGNETSAITESELNDTTAFPENETLDDTGYVADMSADEEEHSDVIDPTVMMLTETSVNTMPFLDNLFWSQPRSKSMPNLPVEEEENCTVELFIFEKHTTGCRRNWTTFTNENSFIDGDFLFETIGRLSFPTTCTDSFKPDTWKSTSGESVYKKESADLYKKLLKSLENYMKNKQFYEMLNEKSMAPFDVKLQKYIMMDKDSESKRSSGYDIEELYLKKKKSVQFHDIYTNTRTSKWYDGFLICFGLKDSADMSDIESLEVPRDGSSYLVTKYLKI